MEVIFLIGFMGTGKTTLGRALGALPNWTYIDLDDAMEQRQGCSVSDIFKEKGEKWFRSEETRLLRELATEAGIEATSQEDGEEHREDGRVTVIGCGGGTPCHSDNMEWMNAHGRTVLLRATLPTLQRRLLEAQQQRPLLRGLSPEELRRFIELKQLERAPHYERASHILPSDLLESEQEIAQTVASFRQLLDI